MPKIIFRSFLFAAIGCALAAATLAHHSESEFDFKSIVEVEGNVTNLDWRSPHARLYVNVLSPQGRTVKWDFELPSPMTLMRRGWKRDSLKPGDHVKVRAAKARRYPDIGYATAIRGADGKPLFTGVTQIYEPQSDSSAP